MYSLCNLGVCIVRLLTLVLDVERFQNAAWPLMLGCLFGLVGGSSGCVMHHQQLCETLVNPRVCPNCMARDISECHCFAPTADGGYHETNWHRMGNASFESPVTQNFADAAPPIEFDEQVHEGFDPASETSLNDATMQSSSQVLSDESTTPLRSLPVEAFSQEPLGQVPQYGELRVVGAWDSVGGEGSTVAANSARRMNRRRHFEPARRLSKSTESSTRIVDPRTLVGASESNLDYYQP
ncbi:hypothetical protein SAMN06265222_1011077 [Neorhodopirellula lusitana]|uniref:Secreted protein n=1 Tax=Neorhodopirellula lusitana TaxID=445327 RepID=A0ABY1PT18_9BACT|nr:hypothetical protein [Neorhodopirellula lusitana]SMP44092.1 hypothetical protein SAMN06265222_1011077 [Neorhodopirellula lusitana]